MKNLFKLFAFALLITFASCDQNDDYGTPVDPTLELIALGVDIIDPFTGVIQGKSKLRRNDNSLTVNFKATDLTPDYAYTLWWVIWNKPQNCQTPNSCGEIDFLTPNMPEVEVLYATGHLAGRSGYGNFAANLKEGDDTGSINSTFGLPSYGGLKDASTAEVHLVLRSHGPAIPGQVADQIGSYEGGCVYDLGAFTGDIPDAVGECADILAAVHLPN